MRIPDKLETDRLVIRPFLHKDLVLFTEFLLDQNATKYLTFTKDQLTIDGAKLLFNAVIDSYSTDNPIFALAITLKKDVQFIGSCGFSPIDDEKTVESYYSLLPKYWGIGYVTEALKKIIEYAFDHLGIKKIVAYVNPENTRSLNVAKKVGMKCQGITTSNKTGLPRKLFTIKNKEQ